MNEARYVSRKAAAIKRPSTGTIHDTMSARLIDAMDRTDFARPLSKYGIGSREIIEIEFSPNARISGTWGLNPMNSARIRVKTI